MLTCYGHKVRFPRSELAFIAFRLAALDTLFQIDLAGELGDGQADEPIGYLVEVPFLEHTAPAVQVDLLAELWQRHRVRKLQEASLLDAAVLYACCRTAGRLIQDEPDVADLCMKNGPRQVRCHLGRRTPERLIDRFFAFWDGDDFLWLSELEDLTPEHARIVRELMEPHADEFTRKLP